MRIVAFSDWRVQSIEKLIKFLRCFKPMPSVIIYSGDDLGRFTDGNKNIFEELAKFSDIGVLGVIGNDDTKIAKKVLDGNRVIDVHDKPVVIEQYAFMGQEGCTGNIGLTLYSEEEVAKHLEEITKLIGDEKIILVSHSPPKGYLDYGVRFGFNHIGSEAITEFIKRRKPLLVICGHVHSYGGQTTKIGESTIVNVASHDSPESKGIVAIIDLVEDDISLQWHDIKSTERIDDISCVKDLAIYSGKGYHVFDVLRKAGVHTIHDLMSIDVELLSLKTGFKKSLFERGKLYAKALLERRAFLAKQFKLPDGGRIYCDIETNLANDYVWLIGVLYETPIGKRVFKQFVAFTPEDEQKLITDFIAFLKQSKGTFIYNSGCYFEERILQQRIKELAPNFSSFFLKLKKIDLAVEFQKGVLVSPSGYSSKTLSKVFGYHYKHDIDGWLAGVEFERYLRSKDHQERKVIIDRLKEYNKDDVFSIQHIVKALNL